MNWATLHFWYFKRIIRSALDLIIALFTFPIAWFWPKQADDPICQAVADMLLLGFYGSSKYSLSARLLARQVQKGQVNGVFFVSQNIGTLEEVKGLIQLFKRDTENSILAIDHEGGAVQRLNQRHGFIGVPSALKFSISKTPLQVAKTIYTQAGRELASLGFNLNLGPVVDFHNPCNEAIGIYNRSYGIDSNTICAYSTAFVEGFAQSKVMCTLKHFPGHGNSVGDSHYRPANLTYSWQRQELEPFVRLIASGHAPMIMVGHLKHDAIDPTGVPATISKTIITKLLRDQMAYTGVIVTDDLDMGAVSSILNRRDAVIEAIKAGNDLLMIKNLFNYDPLLPQKIIYWVRSAIQNGEIPEAQILQAGQRMRTLVCATR